MLRAIAFEDEASFEAGEIDGVAVDRDLTAKFESIQLATAYERP